MFLRIFLCITFSILATFNIWAQFGSISGTVSDEFGPLPGAKVTIQGTDQSVNCDLNGAFKIDVKPGSYVIEASYLLFLTEEQLTTISFNNLNPELHFVLESGSAIDANTSLGSRSKPKTQMENVVAVDVISSHDILNSGQTTLTGVLHFLIPSFHSTPQTIADGTDHIDPSTLRGLGPDQMLVLLNGKRRHSSSLVNVNGTVGRGTVGTDLNTIPLSAIDRIEILRDGAAAQYGSDAIAGVMNIILKESTNIFALTADYSPTLKGDGKESMLSANYGAGIGLGGFINVSAELKNRESINRAGNYTGHVYSENDSLDALLIDQNNFYEKLTDYDHQQVMEIGAAKIQNANVFFNLLVPLKNGFELYADGGLNYRKGESRGFYRFPKDSSNVVHKLFPNGFSPVIVTNINDQSLTMGLHGIRNGWDIDFSNSFGKNQLGFSVKNSNNASMGLASPTTAYAGGFQYRQNITHMDFSKKIRKISFLESVYMAFGGEFRVEQYHIFPGETSSWIDGKDTLASGIAYAPGIQVFPGFQPQNALDKQRTNFAAYGDLEFELTQKWLLEAAARFERYNQFGDNVSWKLASRYLFSKDFSLRASYSTGFRAPSLHQVYFNNIGTQFIGGEQLQVGTFNNESPIAKALGIEKLKAETSTNFSGGISTKITKNLTLSADFYLIKIKDRIVLSGRVGPGFESVLMPVGASSAQFFTNAVNTQTIGFDLVPTYSLRLGKGLFRISAAYNSSSTNIVGEIQTSKVLEGSESILFNREEIARLEVAQPSSKTIVAFHYSINQWNFMLKTTRFGSVTYIHSSDGSTANWITNAYSGQVESRDQVFSPKWVTDLMISYRFNNYFMLYVGANNLLNVYPDKHQHSENTNEGNFTYSRRVQQFGVKGASYFARLSFSL